LVEVGLVDRKDERTLKEEEETKNITTEIINHERVRLKAFPKCKYEIEISLLMKNFKVKLAEVVSI